jgi:hypothetical protein
MNKSRKRVCLVWKSDIKIEELKIFLTKLKLLDYEFYLIIRTNSNDIKSSKEIVKEFSELASQNLVKEHVSYNYIFYINIFNAHLI